MTYKNSLCGINYGGGKGVINAAYCNNEKILGIDSKNSDWTKEN